MRWSQLILGRLYKQIRRGQIDERGTLSVLMCVMQALSVKRPRPAQAGDE